MEGRVLTWLKIKVTKNTAEVMVGRYLFERRHMTDFYSQWKCSGVNSSFGSYSRRFFLKRKEATREANISDLRDING